MDSLDKTEIILGVLYTAPIVCCVFVSNLFFTIFRWYQASKPLSQNLLINTLFCHLSVIFQWANLYSAIFLFTHSVYVLDNQRFTCFMFKFRQFHVVLSVTCILLLSVAKCLSHFKPELYSRTHNKWIGRFCASLLILVFICFIMAQAFHCNIDVCTDKNSCQTRFLILVSLSVLILAIFFNTMLILHYLFKKYFSISGLSLFFRSMPAHGFAPTNIPLNHVPTISSSFQNPPPLYPSEVPESPFTTGLITMVFIIITGVILVRFLIIFSIPFSSTFNSSCVLVFTSIVPVYWSASNKDHRDYARRVLKLD
jgi:hypothetical protein